MPCNSQLTCVAVSLLIAVPALADDTISAPVEGLTRVLEGEWFGDQPWEPDGLVSVVHVDNDIFFPGTSDADYTAGLGLSLIGPETRTSPFSLVPAVEYLDRLLPGGPAVTGNEAPGARYAMQLGTLGFTPDDLSSSEPLPDDRPYASLLLLSGARQWKEPLEPVAHRSTLTVGFLGLNVFSFFQKTWHGIT
ncbi:MAG TPA: DUF2219 family protein, partial [Chromatiales bacterium]|nr:DUF2219 family protein [Chromatiales bacterium]